MNCTESGCFFGMCDHLTCVVYTHLTWFNQKSVIRLNLSSVDHPLGAQESCSSRTGNRWPLASSWRACWCSVVPIRPPWRTGMAWVLHDKKRVEMLGRLVGLLVPGCFCNDNFSEWLGRMWWNVGYIPQDIVTLRKFTADEFSHLHTVRGSLTCRVAAISNLGFLGYL